MDLHSRDISSHPRTESGEEIVKGLFLIAAILIAYPAVTQGQSVKVTVMAGNSGRESHEIADKLAGKIGSSSRYALVTADSADILILVDCLSNTVGERAAGVTCNTSLSYWPVSGVSLYAGLPQTLATGDESRVADDLFNAFVRQSSDDKLAEAAKNFIRNLNSAIARFPHGVN
jgi:hypothetical protein